jgi:hypothetical protein
MSPVLVKDSRQSQNLHLNGLLQDPQDLQLHIL